MYLPRIAWRNLTRNPARTIIAMAAIAVVVMIVVFSRGFMVGVTESMFSSYIDNELGHVRIVDEEYNLREALLPLDYFVDGVQGQGASQLVAELEARDDVAYVLPRIRFGAMASRNDDMVRMLGIGIDLSAAEQHGVIPEEISAGRMPREGNEIVVGSRLLEDLGLELDDRVTLVFSDYYQSLRGRTFDIVGIRDSGIADIDRNYFYLPLETAQEMLHLEDEVNELLVFSPDMGDAEALAAGIVSFLHGQDETRYEALPWNRGTALIEVYAEMNNIMVLVYILFIAMGAVVIVSALTMIVRERTSEIGMMGSLGLKGGDIMRVFLLEGTFMGVLGSLAGVVAGGVITWYFSLAGLRVDAFADMLMDVEMLMEPVFYTAFNLENLLVSFLLSVVVVAASCFIPALQAAKMEPVHALRYVDD